MLQGSECTCSIPLWLEVDASYCESRCIKPACNVERRLGKSVHRRGERPDNDDGFRSCCGVCRVHIYRIVNLALNGRESRRRASVYRPQLWDLDEMWDDPQLKL